LKKLYKDSLLVFLRSKNLSLPYFVLLALIVAYFGFCFNNYLHYREIFSVTIWLVRPDIFLIAFFIYFSYELAVRLYDNNMAEHIRTYRHGLLKVYGAIILSLLTVVSIPSIMFFAFILFMYFYIDVQYPPLFDTSDETVRAVFRVIIPNWYYVRNSNGRQTENQKVGSI